MPSQSILKTVAALAVMSAFLAVGVTTLNAFFPMPLAADFVHAFIESFKACIFAISVCSVVERQLSGR